MKFDKTKVYTAVNADELKKGDKVIVANNLADLRWLVEVSSIEDARKVEVIRKDCELNRFCVKSIDDDELCFGFNLAYLVRCAEQKDHYRPYADTKEMVEDYKRRFNVSVPDNEKPMIWLRSKISLAEYLVTGFCGEKIEMSDSQEYMGDTFRKFTYLDGSPCGMEK